MEALQAITDAVVCCGNDGTITTFNKAAEKTFLWSAEDVVGQNVSVLMPSPYREIHDNFLERFFDTGTKKLIGITRELKGMRANGETFPLEISLGQITRAEESNGCPAVTPSAPTAAQGKCPVIHGGSGLASSRGFVAVIRDVSAQVQKRMEATQRYKTDFEELAPIGKGGFGSVYKCKNKLDGQLYAVKKIYLQRMNGGFELEAMSVDARDSLTRLLEFNLSSEATAKLKEVQLLASITQHVNIVRYYYSWVEILPIEEVDADAVRFLERQPQTPRIATTSSSTQSSSGNSLSASGGSFMPNLSSVEKRLWDAIHHLRSSNGSTTVEYVCDVLSGIADSLRAHLDLAATMSGSTSGQYIEVAQCLWLETEQVVDDLRSKTETVGPLSDEDLMAALKACKSFSHELYLLHQQWPRTLTPNAREWPVAVITHFLLFMTAVSNCNFSGTEEAWSSDEEAREADVEAAAADRVACRICEELISVDEFERHCDTCIGKFKVSRRDSAQLTGKRKTTIEDFTVLKKLAAGAFGRVFLVKKKNTGDIYALKVLRKDDTLQHDLLPRVTAERDILFGADCPFIVNLYYSFQSPANLYLVMDYLPGGDLGDMLLNLSYLDEDHAKSYAAEIVVALEYLHCQGIVHRDLKPDNILIGKEGHLKLTDFGLSKHGLSKASPILNHPLQQGMVTEASADSLQHSAVGTPDYLAPEIVLDQGHSFAVDWWALGCTLYEMLIGIPPFNDEEEMKVFQRIIECDYDLPPGECSPEAADLIGNFLCLDPSIRLGAHGADEIKEHPFFDGIDWDTLGEGPSPFFVPKLADDTTSSYFNDATDVQPGTALDTTVMPVPTERSSMVAARKTKIQRLRLTKAVSTATVSPDAKAKEDISPAPATDKVVPPAIPEFSFVNLRALQQRTQEEAASTPRMNSPALGTPKSRASQTSEMSVSHSLGTNVTFGPEESNGVATLYIQMQLHESRTLREVLDLPGRIVSRANAMDIFVQIVEGLRHVHHRGIVHRDLKPTNIFLDEDNVVRSCSTFFRGLSSDTHADLTKVKIGDFGLATLYAHHGGAQTLGDAPAILDMEDDMPAPEFADDMTLGVGSAYYAAPEQLGHRAPDLDTSSTSGGTDEEHYVYSQKVDIFALGIILAELLLPSAATRHERYVMMTGLRKRQFPGAIMESFPDVVPWIQRMLSPNPEDRPSTHEILHSALFAPFVSHGTAIAAGSAMRDQGIKLAQPLGNAPCIQCSANQQLVKELAEEVREKDDRIATLLQQLRTLRNTQEKR